MQATARMASVVSSTLPARRRLTRDVSRMNRAFRKWLTTALILGGLFLFVAFATFRYQNYRIGKINFIILDNQRENVAGLSSEEFIRYVQQCGGSLDSSTAP